MFTSHTCIWVVSSLDVDVHISPHNGLVHRYREEIAICRSYWTGGKCINLTCREILQWMLKFVQLSNLLTSTVIGFLWPWHFKGFIQMERKTCCLGFKAKIEYLSRNYSIHIRISVDTDTINNFEGHLIIIFWKISWNNWRSVSYGQSHSLFYCIFQNRVIYKFNCPSKLLIASVFTEIVI